MPIVASTLVRDVDWPARRFKYTNSSCTLAVPMTQDSDRVLYACTCVGLCTTTCFCMEQQKMLSSLSQAYRTGAKVGFNYTVDGRLKDARLPTVECGDLCSCGPGCASRVRISYPNYNLPLDSDFLVRLLSANGSTSWA